MNPKHKTATPRSPLITVLSTIAVILGIILIADLTGSIHLSQLFLSSDMICETADDSPLAVTWATAETWTTLIPRESDFVTAAGKPVLFCDENKLPVRDEQTGKLTCIAAEKLTTDCLGPDGKSYAEWDTFTFYNAVQYSGNGQAVPTCESRQKTCSQWVFVSIGETAGSGSADTFVHRTCQTIDTSDTELLTCSHDWNQYLPWETIVRYNEQEILQWKTCKWALAVCTQQWKWYTNFPESTAAACTFSRALAEEFVAANVSELIDEKSGLPTSAALWFVETATGASCTTPWGQKVEHGKTVISFADESINFTEECISKTSLCVDWSWNNGITPYVYESCTIKAPKTCDINWYILQHDSKHTFYKQWSLINGTYTCQEQTRYCFDWKMDGESAYKLTECSQQTTTPVWPASCPSPYGAGTARKHGQQGVAYLQDSVRSSEACTQTNIVCAYWQIRFGTFDTLGAVVGQTVYKDCSAKAAADCTREFGTIKDGDSVTAYKDNSVPFWSSCESQIRTCSDGYLAWSYTAQSCSVGEGEKCETKCWTIVNGQTITSYAKSSVAFWNGETCQTYAQVSTCEDWTLDKAVQASCSCKIEEPVGCTAPNGSFIPHMWSVTLYQLDKVYGQAQDGVDECPRQVRQCINWQFYDFAGKPSALTYKYSKCEIIPPSAPVSQ